MNITFEYSAPHSPQYNGLVERQFLTLCGEMRAAFVHAGSKYDEACQRYW